ncbi:E3 ubiquitin-protein ligase UHRF1-like [Anoplophora glabripennis]|uniref:E3 ubiquitin-protein ligase UHRF1-like n=1 Tax=Anoplophora glabripennis TaxID=217634 RepID=UPI0008758A7D|nr:E3 ubiquitin-protein ligase UHRF1-like [Anoplophora glabripennis]
MYVKIRKLGALQGEGDIVINISKMALIQELRQMIEKDIQVVPEQQMLLYKGKQLIDDHRVMDYDISLNDVIQLIVRSQKPLTEGLEEKEVDKKEDNNVDNNKRIIDAQSKFYKVEDLIDVRLEENGAWYEAVISKIFTKGLNNENTPEESNLIFKVKGAEHVITFEGEASFIDIRPRSYYTYKTSELEKGMTVLASYNIEETKSRGPWYDFKVEEVSPASVTGTILVGRDRAPIENCSIKFVDEIMRIEEPVPLTERSDVPKQVPRKYPYNCDKCKDVPGRKCRECGCRVCAGKESCDTMILCDECDYGYHIACLSPPLESVPEEDEWYCPDCKTDVSEIVKAGEKLKISNKKAKMASNKGESSRDWGKGMACVGRTKECTIVPKDHYGPVPGVEVGTCWKFRLQASEAGIHRPHVAGIHGRETDGAYSLVLSGGYEDDIDNGEEFYYTGSGGRDLSGNKRCSEQSCDQKLTRMNKALALNCNATFNDKTGAESKDWKKGKPVRVVRNYKGAKHSKYAPQDGNRYDGLYKVVKYYPEKGKSGFVVWKYLLRRDDPTPAPWEKGGQELEMIYPPGYLEAQEAQGQKKNKENKSKSPDKAKRGSKRKTQEDVKPLTEFFNTPKKQKMTEYKLSSELEELISLDKGNEKLWSECREVLKEGKQKFLSKVEEIFMCICCQEVVYEPVTTECKHNICKACLKRSFASEIFNCPYCRHELGESYDMEVNTSLGKVLKLLFPGYEAAR